MIDFRRGILAGVVAAAVFLIMSVILEVTGVADSFPMFVAAARLELWAYPVEPWFVVLQAVPRLTQGVVFGAVFAALYSYLPGRTAVPKAIVVSLMVWVIGVFRGSYISLNWPWQTYRLFLDSESCGTAGSICVLGWALIRIASIVVMGALVGAIWTRLKAREALEPRPGNAALLIGFAIGIWMWLGAALNVISWVVMGGFWENLLSGTSVLWMGAVLYPSAAVLGLAGWILVLLGWRRTRRGETGFRRGLVGGILMAVTGHMLLPGIVSIIGAVLSRREPEEGAVSGSESVAQ